MKRKLYHVSCIMYFTKCLILNMKNSLSTYIRFPTEEGFFRLYTKKYTYESVREYEANHAVPCSPSLIGTVNNWFPYGGGLKGLSLLPALGIESLHGGGGGGG